MISKRLSRVLIAPLVSEKSVKMQGVEAFWVQPQANKADIKLAVEKMFDVKVEAVRTVTKRIRPKRSSKQLTTTRRKFKKKAYVKLAEGQALNIAEQ